MTLQLKKNLKHKLNLDFLLLYQEPIIKGGGGGKGQDKIQTTGYPLSFYGSLPFCVRQIACVAGVRKGRERELRRKTTREGGGRKGTPARKPLFSPSRLLVKKKITKITQL